MLKIKSIIIKFDLQLFKVRLHFLETPCNYKQDSGVGLPRVACFRAESEYFL